MAANANMYHHPVQQANLSAAQMIVQQSLMLHILLENMQFWQYFNVLLLTKSELAKWWRWRPGFVVARWSRSTNVVTLRRARLILGSMTIYG